MIIEREAIVQPRVKVATAAPPATATPIEMGQFSGGRILVPDTLDSTTFTFWECDTADGTYYKVLSGGSEVTATRTASQRNSVEIPAACNPCKFIKIQSSGDNDEEVTVVKKT